MRDYLAFFGGRVRVEAKGHQLEGFINHCYRCNIRLLRPVRISENRLQFTLPCRAFRRLRPPAFRSGTRIRILKKSGLFMAIRPYKKRWGLLLGILLFLGLVYYSSCFIWNVEVLGCKTISATEIAEDLKQKGLDVGCSRQIDVNRIENQYLMGNDKIKWMSINIKGTTAYVEVREQGIPPKMIDGSVPTNIYAQRDGIIRSINAYGGTPCVVAGQPVIAGDLLVTGDWTDSYGIRRLSHCLATVMAETRREKEITIPFSEIQPRKTGKKQKFFAISFGKLRIPLYFKKKIDYNNIIVSWERALTFGDFALPLRLSSQCYEEVVDQKVTRTEDEARKMAYARLGFYEQDELSSLQLLNRETSETLSDGAFVLNAVYECVEEIGIAMPIEGATDAENTQESG